MSQKNKIEPVTFLNILNNKVQLTEHIPVGSLQLYTKYKHRQDVPVKEANQIITEKENCV